MLAGRLRGALRRQRVNFSWVPIKIRRGKLTARRDDSLRPLRRHLASSCGVALSAFAQAITIVGLPNAYVLAKSLGTVFNPVGKNALAKPSRTN